MPLSKTELEKFLAESRLAHLATTTKTGKPRVSPIWFFYEKGTFYFTTRLGRLKGQHMQRNPLVALSIATDNRPYRAVCAFGKVTIVEQDRDEWLQRISFKYGKKEAERWMAGAVKQRDRVVMNLRPERVLSWHYGRDDSIRQEKGISMATKIS